MSLTARRVLDADVVKRDGAVGAGGAAGGAELEPRVGVEQQRDAPETPLATLVPGRREHFPQRVWWEEPESHSGSNWSVHPRDQRNPRIRAWSTSPQGPCTSVVRTSPARTELQTPWKSAGSRPPLTVGGVLHGDGERVLAQVRPVQQVVEGEAEPGVPRRPLRRRSQHRTLDLWEPISGEVSKRVLWRVCVDT